MTERRSNRARSKINYSKYEGDDDDDFADPTPPMRKLKKDKENCNKSVQEKEKIVTTDKKSKSRKPPPEDRLLDLHLKKALAASLKDCGNLQTESDNGQTDETDDYDRCCLVNDKLTSTQKDSGKDSKVKNGDEIEVISTITVSDSPPRKRQKTTSRYNCLDSESDNDQDRTYAAESDASESDASDVDEFEPDNDVDDFNSITKSKKKRKVQTVTKVSKTPVKTPTLSKSISKLEPRLSSTSTVTVNTPGVSSSARTVTPKSTSFPKTPVSLPQKIPSWTPPGPAGRHGGGSLNIKSPGGIRIGLSRQQRVKALHPSLTVQP